MNTRVFRQSMCAVGVVVLISFVTMVILFVMHGVRCDRGDRGELWFFEPEPVQRGLEAQFFGNTVSFLRTTLGGAFATPTEATEAEHTPAGSAASRALQEAAVLKIQDMGAFLPLVPLVPDLAVEDDTGRCAITLTNAGPFDVTVRFGGDDDGDDDDRTLLNYQRGTCSRLGFTLTNETVQPWTPGISTAAAADVPRVVYFEDATLDTYTVFGRLREADVPLGIRLIVLFVDPFDVQSHPAQYPSPGRAAREDQTVVLVSSALKPRFVGPGGGGGRTLSATVGPRGNLTTSKVTVQARTRCLCPRDPLTGVCVQMAPQTVLAARSDSLAAVGDQIPDLALLVQMADTMTHHRSQDAQLRTTLCMYEFGSIFAQVQASVLADVKDLISLSQTGARNGVPIILTSRGPYEEQVAPWPDAATFTGHGLLSLPFALTTNGMWTVTGYKVARPVNTTEAQRSYAIASLRSHSFDPISELQMPSSWGINSMIAALAAAEWLTAVSTLDPVGLDGVTGVAPAP